MEYQALNADKNEIRLLTLYSSHNSNLRPTGAVCCTLENLPLEKNLKRSYNLRSQPDIFSAYWDENVWESSPASSLVTNTLDQHASHPVGPKRYKDCIRGRYSWGEYVALSYTWGDPNKRREFSLMGSLCRSLNIWRVLCEY